MTKRQKYRISKEFKRRTFDTNPIKRMNYVHQVVRFDAYLVIKNDDLFCSLAGQSFKLGID